MIGKEIKSIEQFYEESEKYVDIFNIFTKKHNLTNRTQADHICYKCESKSSFENIRSILEFESEYIFQSIISKRRISYIKLKKGILTDLGEIYFLELSDQKPDRSQKEGFDHIEVYPTSFSYEDMVNELESKEKVIKVERPHHITHDIEISSDFLLRCTRGPLIDKIKNSEMI